MFVQTLNSFGQLEELAFFGFVGSLAYSETELELNLPMLNNIHLENFNEIVIVFRFSSIS